ELPGLPMPAAPCHWKHCEGRQSLLTIAFMPRVRMRDKRKWPRTCASFCATARFENRIWKTIRRCRTLTRSAVFRRCTAACAALLSEAKVLAHPASIDNVPTDGGKEDHVSMGMTAAVKLRSIAENAERMIAIELITAAEGLEYRAPLQPGRGVKQAYELVRKR